MTDMENPADAGALAESYFNGGFNCAEATLKAVCEALGLEYARMPAMATAFGGGIGRRGHTCGAVSGAVVAAGLHLGRMGPKEDRSPSYTVAGRLVDEFIGRFGSVVCRDISGVDLMTEEGQRQYREHAHTERCCPAVRFAAATMCGFLVQFPGRTG